MFKQINKLLYKAFNTHKYIHALVIGLMIGLVPNLFLSVSLFIIFLTLSSLYTKSKSQTWKTQIFISIGGIPYLFLGVFVGKAIHKYFWVGM